MDHLKILELLKKNEYPTCKHGNYHCTLCELDVRKMQTDLIKIKPAK